jgi:hypothetical protein
MIYRPSRPSVIVVAAIAVASPIVLHGHFTGDCSPHAEVCGGSEMGYSPDEQAPHHAPGAIRALPRAAYTSSAPSTPGMRYQFKIT